MVHCIELRGEYKNSTSDKKLRLEFIMVWIVIKKGIYII